jgi:hypothetical protein
MVRHLESFGLTCAYAGDIATGQDALRLDTYGDADAIITNPPYTRPLMHALIWHFARILPTWLLLEMDWASTKRAAPFMPSCSEIVAVGRLKWIAGTKHGSYENFAWYHFDARHAAGPVFRARGSVPAAADSDHHGLFGRPAQATRHARQDAADAPSKPVSHPRP